MPHLTATDVTREYRLGRGNLVRALRGVDLTIDRGTFAAILGRSGSGKSTLMNLIGGLDRPTSGSIRVGDADLSSMDARRLAAFRAHTIGFVFQAFHLQPRFLAWENVALPLVFQGVPRAERRRRALALLERVGLADRADHRPTELSGGEQQRVALARSLVAKPQLLLGDEPTGNLDSATSEQILSILREVNAGGTTVIVVTHDRELARANASQLIEMVDGRVAAGAAS